MDFWETQEIWDLALRGVKVVFSTYAVLADAMTHGFIPLARLNLIVFDEAHSCRKAHPGRQLMRGFYQDAKSNGQKIPKILGLTAFVDARNVQELERTLDANCRSPMTNHQAMICKNFEKRPTKIFYPHNGYSRPPIPHDLDMKKDAPNELRNQSTTQSIKVFETMRRFFRQAGTIWETLGAWAVHRFLTHRALWLNSGADYGQEIPCRKLIENLLSSTAIQLEQQGSVSEKVQTLISLLAEKIHPDFSGVIFVREKISAFILTELINTHPKTRGIFWSAACVGSSNRSEHRYNSDLANVQKGEDVVRRLRDGRINLIVATSVLEEGIDIPACHLIISFDLPDNIESFIQRRGRARHHIPEHIIMIPSNDESFSCTLERWNELEKEMQNARMDHLRTQKTTGNGNRMNKLTLEHRLATGALLTNENAIAHLYHFCAVANNASYVHTYPQFSFESNHMEKAQSTVLLPSCIHPTLRIVKGLHWWKTKQQAQQDTAFQAIRLLHMNKLVDDHFLPLFSKGPSFEKMEIKSPSHEIPRVDEYEAMWARLPGNWLERKLYRCRVTFTEDAVQDPDVNMAVYLPFQIEDFLQLHFSRGNHSHISATMHPPGTETMATPELRQMLLKTSAILLFSTQAKPGWLQYPELLPFFTPDIPLDELEEWLTIHEGSTNMQGVRARVPILSPQGLIRSRDARCRPQIFLRWAQEIRSGALLIECRALPKMRRLFSVPLVQENALSKSTKHNLLMATRCSIDFLPWKTSQASLTIPTIIQWLQLQLNTQALRRQVLQDFPQMDSQLISEALAAPSFQLTVNYQRLEFFGDSILKFHVTAHVFDKYPLWPEGYLSKFREHAVSNATLIHAAVNASLQEFICAEIITVKRIMSFCTQDKFPSRCTPGKMYADVVEALIAAAYKSAGLPLSRKLLEKFLPDISSVMPNFVSPDEPASLPPLHLEQKLDRILGYCFQKRSLIWQALTHPSQRDCSTASYQRLEFLGDAVLELLVSKALYDHYPGLSEGRMTEARAAIVNGDFLAFLCMEFSIKEPYEHLQHISRSGMTAEKGNLESALWNFMRHDSPEITKYQHLCNRRYREGYSAIKDCLDNGQGYPWAALARLELSKFYSDIIESVIGALYVDNNRTLDACELFLKRIGVTNYLIRFLEDDFQLEHPKNLLIRLTHPRKLDFRFSQTASGLHNLSVCIDEVEVAYVDSCSTKKHAEARGADAAHAVLLHTHTHTHTHNSLHPEVSSLEGTYTLFDLSIAYILS
ncbi:ATP-dependent helicase dcl2 [Penicillium angulare]|uniref:ATP-dependent helicase dcl2 n=1 Tax=Penicillium angulare TaxID=116970 RepID=UPI002540D017|nr:ATP-dependent helicase dcl2 [Penicillium angulare]KAJ5291466.1 ATP-dependent helicase dcl2 [Penicillium angulare]